MNDALRVRLAETPRDLQGELQLVAQGGLAAANPIGERAAVIERHHKKGAAVRGLLHAIDQAEIGMVKRGGRAGLTKQPLFVRRMDASVSRKEFERDHALQPLIKRTQYGAHAADPGDVEHTVVFRDDLSGGETLKGFPHDLPGYALGNEAMLRANGVRSKMHDWLISLRKEWMRPPESWDLIQEESGASRLSGSLWIAGRANGRAGHYQNGLAAHPGTIAHRSCNGPRDLPCRSM